MHLGVTHCYHGWDIPLPPSFQQYTWWRLLRRKYRPRADDPAWSAADFDGLLGHCRAVSDMPAAVFAEELMRAYPDAKVILNERTDLDGWFRSFDATFGDMDRSWVLWVAHLFNSELFWIVHTMSHGFLGAFFRGDWRKNGKEVYREHVSRIRGLGLPEDKLLVWNVEQGWKPLCAFLGKEIPQENFPNGNTPADFEKRINDMMKARLLKAMMNMALTLGACFAVGVGLWYGQRKR